MNRTHVALVLATALAGGCSDPSVPIDDPPICEVGLDGGTGTGPRIRAASFSQAVEVPVFVTGELRTVAERQAPLIAGRPGVFVAQIEVPSDWSPSEVELQLRINETIYSASETVVESSDASDPSTWLVIYLPATAFVVGATYSAALLSGEHLVDTISGGCATELGAIVTGPLKVRLVPFQVGGLTPDLSESVVGGMREALFAFYPVTDVAIDLGSAEVWGQPYDLGDILVQVGVVQETAQAAGEVGRDVFYYAVTNGGVASRADYEGRTGTSENGGADPQRAFFAAGAAFGDERSESTFVHEMGHVLQLEHVPCTGTEEDPVDDYPYDNGSIGKWGWDYRTGDFVPPAEAFDVMGYCRPRWISDYSYALAAKHVAVVQTFSN